MSVKRRRFASEFNATRGTASSERWPDFTRCIHRGWRRSQLSCGFSDSPGSNVRTGRLNQRRQAVEVAHLRLSARWQGVFGSPAEIIPADLTLYCLAGQIKMMGGSGRLWAWLVANCGEQHEVKDIPCRNAVIVECPSAVEAFHRPRREFAQAAEPRFRWFHRPFPWPGHQAGRWPQCCRENPADRPG